MPERFRSRPQHPSISRLGGNAQRRRPVIQNEAARIRREIAASHRAWEESPEGKAALIAAHEEAKRRTQERIDDKQAWIIGHIADSALKIAMVYGREEPTAEDMAAASEIIGATFTAIGQPEYQNLQDSPYKSWRAQ